jgi:DNA-binding response OmpR family regulator
VVVKGARAGARGSGFSNGRAAAQSLLQRGLELGQAERLHQVGDRLETFRSTVRRLDARAHNGDVAADGAKGLRPLHRRCVGRLEDDRMDVAQRAGIENRLVSEPGDHPAEQVPHLGVRLTDEDASHLSSVRDHGGNVGCIWYASGMKAGRILVVDDDSDIRGLLRELLGRAGYDVVEAETGKAGLRQLYAASPDLVLLDVSMPELDGWQTLERIRDLSEVPVIMLTARGGELEKVRGLKAGADDYVTKPFGRQELLARVEALMRRSGPRAEEPTTYADGLVSIDFTQREVTVAGTKTDLTPLEFKLLAAFVRHPNQVLSHDQLLELVWGDSLEGSRARAKLYVGYLRQKLADAGAESSPIETIRGFGYRYRPGAP